MILKNNTAKIMVGIAIAFLLFMVSSASAATITVNASGGDADYMSIQAAINYATAGDIIEVQSGTYLENVVVNKTLSLKGIEMPLVNASGSGTAITITSGGSTVDGFNVTGSGTDWNGGDADSGIKIMSDHNSVLNSTAGFNNYGVYLFESENNTIENNSVYSNTEGVYLFYSSNNSVINNTISANTNRGVMISNSNKCTISNNNASGNTDGIYLTTSTNCSISDNVAGSNSNGIYLYSYSNNNTLTNNTALSNTNTGIYLRYSDRNTLTNNTAYENSHNGIYLAYSDRNTLTNNNASENDQNVFFGWHGIRLFSSDRNTLTDNTASKNGYNGIDLDGSYSNILTNNIASENINTGICLRYSDRNTITKNNALNNSYGFYVDTSSDFNRLDKNNLINNTNHNAYDTVGSNSWSCNYYSDYTGLDFDGDGIGDTEYYIAGDAGAKDLLPAIQEWNTSDNSNLGANFTMHQGNSVTLHEEYKLKLAQVDVDGNKAWILLEKNKIEVWAQVINSGDSFRYGKTIDGTYHLIFRGVLDSAFQGAETDLVTITNFYQFSEINDSILIENSNDLPNAAPSITLSSPSSASISDVEGDSRTFTATVDQVADVTWIFDGVALYTNTSVQTASYYNNSAHEGVYNITIVAENANGISQSILLRKYNL